MLTTTASRARENFSELLGRVAYAKERVAIERRGKPFAVLIPFEDLEKLQGLGSSAAAAAGNQAQGSDRALLVEAIEALADGFVIFDADERMVLCNSKYRDVYRPIADRLNPGITLEEIARLTAVHCVGLSTEESMEAWVQNRLEHYRNPGEPIDQHLRDDRWIRVGEYRLPNGWTVGIRTDISELKRRERALRESREKLEEEVAARTADLVAANDKLRAEIAERQRAEIALRESEERFRDFADSASDLFWEMDAELRFSFLSERFTELTGLEPAWLLGKTARQLMDQGDASLDDGVGRDDWLRHIEDLEAHRPFRSFVYSGTTAKGEVVYLAMNGTPVFDGAGRFKGYRGSGSDISERKRAEDALRLARFSLDRAGDAVFWIGSDSRLVYSNETTSKMLGYSGEELSAMRISDIDTEVSPANWPRAWRRIKRESPYTFEARHRTKEGKIIPVEVSIYHLSFGGKEIACSFSRDITKRKQAEEALKASQGETAKAREQLIEALESTSEGFAWYDPDDRLVLFNSRFREIYRQRADLIVPGVKFETLIRAAAEQGEPSEAIGRVDAWVEERLAAYRNAGEPYEQRLNDGRWIRISERRLPDGGTVGIHTDITTLKETQEELLRSERLAAIGRLTATVNHELRNPLGIIQTSMYLIDQYTRGKGLEVEPLLDRANRGLRRCTEIIGDLLDYTRAGQLQREPTAMASWLREVVDEQAPANGISLRCDLAADSRLSVDRERLRRVLINVLDNAVQAIMAQEPAEGSKDAPAITLRTRLRDGRFEIEVEDNGPGIPPENRSKIFEPLFSTKGTGVGLCLTLVKQIMEQHGGSVEVISEAARGTRVVLALPSNSSGERALR